MELKTCARLATAGIVRVVRQRSRTRSPAAAARGLAFGSAGSVRNMSFTWIPRGSSPPNPFEIEFDIAYAVESCFLEEELEKFRAERRGIVIGATPEDHRTVDFAQPAKPSYELNHIHPPTTSRPWERLVAPRQSATQPQLGSVGNSTVVFIQKPSPFVYDGHGGPNDRSSTAEVEAMVDTIAHSHGLHVLQYRSNHDEQILEWLLSSSAGDKIILHWSERLADSPTIHRALSRARASVIILAPLDVELGSLPASVKGVISGFGARSLELAIQACK